MKPSVLARIWRQCSNEAHRAIVECFDRIGRALLCVTGFDGSGCSVQGPFRSLHQSLQNRFRASGNAGKGYQHLVLNRLQNNDARPNVSHVEISVCLGHSIFSQVDWPGWASIDRGGLSFGSAPQEAAE